MNARQEKFIDEYFASGLNGAQAARAAGYSERSATRTASKLLRHAEIRAAIDERLKEDSLSKIAMGTEILRYLSRIVRGQEVEEIVTQRGQLVRCAVPTSQRIKASELLLKVFHAFDKETDDRDNKLTIEIVDATADDRTKGDSLNDDR